MSYDLPNFPPNDFAPDEWDDVDGGMHVSAMAMVSLLGWLVGLGMGWLIWG